ncbi:HAD family hydrolase [Candidatus Poribacteria bacterium]
MTVELKAVIFDVDDTIFDRDRAQKEILGLMVRENPDIFAGIDEEAAVDAFLESDRVTFEDFKTSNPVETSRFKRSKTFLNMFGLSEDFSDKITEMYVSAYPLINVPVEGAVHVVTKLSVRLSLGIVSNGFPDVQYKKLRTLGIKHLFDCILLSGELGIKKPDPRIFWEAASLLGKEPEECLYVGDSYDADVLGAKKARMKVCWFNPREQRPPQTDVRPDFEIRSLGDILGIMH